MVYFLVTAGEKAKHNQVLVKFVKGKSDGP